MHAFICDVSKKRVRNKCFSQTGELTLATIVEVQGDFWTGPVPVAVTFEAKFAPAREFSKSADEDMQERYPAYHSKNFETSEERRFYCGTFYDPLPAPIS